MKVLLYMAISANGYITANPDDTTWVSPEDFAGQAEIAKKTGNIIYGRKTYELGLQEHAIPVPDALNVIMTTNANKYISTDEFFFTSQTPKELILTLEKKGFKEILIAGGAQVNQAFITQNLVDEVYLDIEPILIGKGLPLFKATNFQSSLELIETKVLDNRQTVQLHYLVNK